MLCSAANVNAITVIRDEELESSMYEIVRPIFRAARLDPKTLEIHIIDQEDPNAFVVGGTAIFVSTGMMKFSDNPDAIAGVMAHEVGHIVGGHIIQSKEALTGMTVKTLLGVLAGVALGAVAKSSDVGVGTALGVYSESIGSMMKFTRSQESAADAASVRYMKQLGVDDTGVTEFLQSLESVDRTFYSDVSEYQRTHPITRSRIEFLKAQHIGSANSYINAQMRERYKFAHAKVEGFTSNPSSVLRQYEGDTSEKAQYARAIALYRMHKKTEAIAELDNLIKAHPNSANFYELKGQILFESGDVGPSIQAYSKSHSLNKSSDIIRIEYANVLIYAKQEVQKAIVLLKQVVSKNRYDSIAWGLLAKAYDLNREEFNKHIALAYEAYIKGDEVTAHKHINAIKRDKNAASSKDLKDLQQLIKDNPVKKDNEEY